jgi:hypothetical protein
VDDRWARIFSKIWSPGSKITLERLLMLYSLYIAANHEYGYDSPLTYQLCAESSISAISYMRASIRCHSWISKFSSAFTG